MRKSWALALALLGAGCGGGTSRDGVRASSFSLLPLAGDADRVLAASSDASVLVGSTGQNFQPVGARWSLTSGSRVAGFASIVGASSDGTTLLGSDASGSARPALAANGEPASPLPLPSGFDGAKPVALSDDGTTAVLQGVGANVRPFVVRNGTATEFPQASFLSALDQATAVSADGSVVYGTVAGGVVRWRGLGPNVESVLSGAATARDCSADGRVVVGGITPSGGLTRAYRHREGGGTTDLGLFEGNATEAIAVSDDGNTVLAVARPSGTNAVALVWWQGRGYRRLLDLLPAEASSPALLNFEPLRLSADGRTVAGNVDESVGFGGTLRNRAFVARFR